MNQTLHLIRAGTLALGLACLSVPANAVVVTVNSVQYDITTVTDTPTNLFTQLQTQPWWGNESTAGLFANQVGSQFGYPHTIIFLGGVGPFFAFSGTPNSFSYAALTSAVGVTSSGLTGSENSPRTFAVATTVPSVPDSGATAVLLGTALAGLIGLRRWLA